MSKQDLSKNKPANEPARRGFLKRAGLIAGAVGGLGVAAVPLSSNGELDRDFPNIPENQASLPPNGKTVLVVGGGLAGMQAAVEMAARGFKVTVLEKSGSPGGKLKSWRDRHFGPADDPEKLDPAFPGYIREHGIHAVWGWYNNLREFLGRYGWPLAATPKDVSMYNFIDKDGSQALLKRDHWPAPYDQLQFMGQLARMNSLAKENHLDALPLFQRLFSFDYNDPKQRAYLDNITIEDYCKKLGMKDEVVLKVIEAMTDMAFFDSIDKASMLALGMSVQLFSGTPQDTQTYNLYVNPTSETFIKPMADFVRKHGGEIHYHTEVTELLVEGKVVGVKVAAPPALAVRRCSICGGLIFDGMEVGGECPYCGATADMIVALTEAQRSERIYRADDVVCALDAPAAQSLVSTNLQALGGGDYFSNILKLHNTAPYVVNLWYDTKGPWEKRMVDDEGRTLQGVYPTGFDYLGVTINRSVRLRDDEGTKWAWSPEYADRNVTVIETQVGRSWKFDGLSTREMAMRCHGELKQMMPELPDPAGWYVNRWRNYTAWRVGDEQARPHVQSPIDNLFFIGDMVFVPHLCNGMEKTNVTAKWVTNLLLDKIGQKAGHIKVLPCGTPSSNVFRFARAVSSVYLPGDEPA